MGKALGVNNDFSENTLRLNLEQTNPILHMLGKKWTIPIFQELNKNDSLRFNQLKVLLGNITPTTLSKTLKELEQYGLIEKKIEDDIFNVNYFLSDFGKDLLYISFYVKERYRNEFENKNKFFPTKNISSSEIIEKIKNGKNKFKNNVLKSLVYTSSFSALSAGICLNHGIEHMSHLVSNSL